MLSHATAHDTHDDIATSAGASLRGRYGTPRRHLSYTVSVCLFCSVGTSLLHGCATGVGPGPLPPPGKIQHVVMIVQENRTPDNLFHGLPNADIANSGKDSKGRIIALTPIGLVVDYDLDHSHTGFVDMYRAGRMDGADTVPTSCYKGDCTFAQFHYVDPNEVQPYLQMAAQYTFADRMFQTNQGPSFPAHQFLIAGTSAPTANSKFFAAENVLIPPGTNQNAGCDGPPGETVALIDPLGNETTKQFPCFEHRTLIDVLDEHGISWKYYAPSAGSIWTGPNAIHHLRFGNDWLNVIIPQSKVLTDISNGQLAQVTWVIPDGRSSDHAGINDGSGPSWVASVVNAIGNSPFWSNTVILITWDDWGGWYDHVAPTVMNSYEYGFRVPLIVMSPYAKKGYVSHVTHDFGSLLRFTEGVFRLPVVGYADSLADDLSDCFDFTQKPTSFQAFDSKYDAVYFLNDRRPPLDPDDD
jgi:phospholipase C